MQPSADVDRVQGADRPIYYPTPQRPTHRAPAAEPLERLYADLELSGREDLNLRPFGPETPKLSYQTDGIVYNPRQRLQTEGGDQSSDSQDLGGSPKDFATRLLPNFGGAGAHCGEQAGGAGADGQGATKTSRARSTAATLGDLQVLWGGRDRLLRVAEVAEQLAVGAWAVYQMCENGELPHVRINNSIRVRPKDLEGLIASRLRIAETPRPHRNRVPRNR